MNEVSPPPPVLEGLVEVLLTRAVQGDQDSIWHKNHLLDAYQVRGGLSSNHHFSQATWIIIPWLVSVNNHGDRKSPKDRVVRPLPHGLFMAYTGGWP